MHGDYAGCDCLLLPPVLGCLMTTSHVTPRFFPSHARAVVITEPILLTYMLVTHQLTSKLLLAANEFLFGSNA